MSALTTRIQWCHGSLIVRRPALQDGDGTPARSRCPGPANARAPPDGTTIRRYITSDQALRKFRSGIRPFKHFIIGSRRTAAPHQGNG